MCQGSCCDDLWVSIACTLVVHVIQRHGADVGERHMRQDVQRIIMHDGGCIDLQCAADDGVECDDSVPATGVAV